MDSINSDLDLLENLSKKISDLLYNNEFSKISEIDIQRKALIKKIKESQLKKNNIKARISKLLENNNSMVRSTEKKIHNTEDYDKHNCLFAFADADLAGDVETRKSRSGKLIMIGSRTKATLISAKSALQKLISLSTTASEIISLMDTVSDVIAVDP